MNKEATFKDPKDGEVKNVYIQPKSKISKREIQVLELVAIGDTSSVISNKLGISRRTVDAHCSNMYKKTGAKNAPHLVAMCYDEIRRKVEFSILFNEATEAVKLAGTGESFNLPKA